MYIFLIITTNLSQSLIQKAKYKEVWLLLMVILNRFLQKYCQRNAWGVYVQWCYYYC